MKGKLIGFLLLIGITVGCSNNSQVASEGEWEPQNNVELVAPSGAGGGWDSQARLIANTIGQEDLMEKNMGVENRAGGSGAIGMDYIANRNDPHRIFVSSGTTTTTLLSNESNYGFEDFTPLTNFGADYGVIAVHADSEWDTLDDLFEEMEKDPSSIGIIGGNNPGGFDHVQFMRLALEKGIEIEDIRYASDNENHGIPAVLSGSAAVLTSKTGSGVAEQVRGGNLKILAILSQERLTVDELFTEVPTAVEQGYDVVSSNWRGVHGPKDMSESQVEYYNELFKQVSESEEFQSQMTRLGWEELYMDSEEFANFLEEEERVYTEILTQIGLIGE
ncbi:tripartite tricarboxylate transporter substrate-binding protein [Alkalihalophilus marmarensis]|uniref:Tricarboxylic transport membrane protein n=1 Tax=Alkalihalophilus marmarensis DSM 21297 TaxID=1188261 RepID=U6SI76_9BACI|nr:tripartite tricarboxylate transporter substrate-binding protein [Alkalihalophilus marmarensis]ERN51293.1 hypothetical protein A33I_20655 [Alkalihalophilus marmarensis DSM 21297]MCM3491585.1 tripartite tricarboxylate transporter substrate-binding protein [Alkalihalophilus marmarensis]